jgi:hypothetical protein
VNDSQRDRLAGEHGYYVVDGNPGVAIRGPFTDWRSAVRIAAELNERRAAHVPRLGVRLVGPPAEAP